MSDLPLRDTIKAAMKAAMKAREKARLGTIRLIQAEFKRIEVDERIEIDDARALAVASVSMTDSDPDVVGLACYTHSGRTPRRLASLRPGVPIAAFTPTEAIARSLTLCRGVFTFIMEVEPEEPGPIAEAVIGALRAGKAELGLQDDDAIVLVQTSVRGGPNALELLRT